MQKFTIEGRLPALNEYTAACRTSPTVGNRLKRKAQEVVGWAIKAARMKPIDRPVTITFRWVEANRRRDLDNVAFGRKFILDALQETGVLKGDGWKHVVGFSDEFAVDKEHPRIVVTLEEVS